MRLKQQQKQDSEQSKQSINQSNKQTNKQTFNISFLDINSEDRKFFTEKYFLSSVFLCCYRGV